MMMEEALTARLLGDAGIIANTGLLNGVRQVHWGERKSNARESFNTLVLNKRSPGRSYDQDGPDPTAQPRIQFDCWGLSVMGAKRLAGAVTALIEQADRSGPVIFGRGRLGLEIDMAPEELSGGLKVYRTMLDFFIPITL